MAEILYRKWRPRSFGELAGQEHVTTTLTNALSTGRVAHAYLFAGPRGTGKTSTGRLLAKALNCTDRQGGEPCNRCGSCVDFLAGRSMDLIELDAASNRGIDEIRSLRDKVAFAPSGEYKVYLIDEVHMLTDAAFNALLKTLEEPPPHVVFILATTETHKVPATIASRCQRFDFRRIPLAAALQNLERICAEEGIDCEPAALELIARTATGSLRDAQNLLDQLATSYGRALTLEQVRGGLGLIGDARAGLLARQALAGDLGGGLSLIASVRDDGLDLRQFQRELVDELRALLMVKSGLEPEDGATVERRRDLQEAVAGATTQQVLKALRAFGEADLKADPNSTLPLDIALAECALGSDGQTGRRADGQREGQSGNRAIGQGDGGQTGRLANGQREGQSGNRAIEQGAGGQTRPSTRPGTALEGANLHDAGSAEGRSPSAGGVGVSPTPTPNLGAGAEPRDSGAQRARLSSDTPLVSEEPVEPRAADEQTRPSLRQSSGQAGSGRTDENIGATAGDLRELMRPIYDEARARSPQLGALINSACDIIESDEGGVVFGFKYPIHADKAGTPPNLGMLVEVVAKVTNRTLAVRCVHDPNVESWKQRESASRSPLVRAAQEMGARVLSSEPEV